MTCDKKYKPLEDKLKVIKVLRAPQTKKELLSFLGAVNYYNKFIKDFAIIAAPLYDLLKKGKDFVWNLQCKESFDQLRNLVGSPPILECYDREAPVVLAVDASLRGDGGVLLQLDKDGLKRPIIFFFHKFRDPEVRYCVIEKEALAVIYGLIRWREYLLGRHFTIMTDHKPLMHVF